MEADYEAKYLKIEDDNWLLKARRRFIEGLLSGYEKNIKILEIGCSGGALMNELISRGFISVQGTDISKQALARCQERGLTTVVATDGKKLNFDNNFFDVIIAMDVLEHIERENEALVEWNRVLKPGGKLLIMVPAFQFLWSDHDIVNNHYRRYSKPQLLRVLSENNFKIVRSSYWNFVLFFPVSIIRITGRLLNRGKHEPKDQLFDFGFIINKLLESLLWLENLLLRIIGFPLGVSVFAIAQKRLNDITSGSLTTH